MVGGFWDGSRDLTRFVRESISVFSEDLIRTFPRTAQERSPVPIFIIGMPRSGTTLVEQILASHHLVKAGGERGDIHSLAAGLPMSLKSRLRYPKCVRVMTASEADKLRDAYFASIAAVGNGVPFFVDKNVTNCFLLGLISVVLPHAKVIECIRDPRDVCLSGFFQHFSDGNLSSIFCDPKSILAFYKSYRTIMAHWRRCVPLDICRVHYEQLTEDPEGTIRNLLSQCGLPWDDRCLQHHQTARAVKTASQWQVKDPVYSSSVGRWRKYRGYIKPWLDYFGEGDVCLTAPVRPKRNVTR